MRRTAAGAQWSGKTGGWGIFQPAATWGRGKRNRRKFWWAASRWGMALEQELAPPAAGG